MSVPAGFPLLLPFLLLRWLDSPAFLFLIFLVPSLMLYLALDRSKAWPGIEERQGWLFGAIAAGMLGLFLAGDAANLFTHAFLTHPEPVVASLSWWFHEGRQLYHDIASPQRYTTLYGPYLFIYTGFSQSLFGPGVFGTKLPGALGAAAALLLLFITVRKKSDSLHALYMTGIVAAIWFQMDVSSFWIMSDPAIMLCVAAGLFATTLSGISGPLLLGLALGIAMNLKIHTFIDFLPLTVLAYRQKWRFGWIVIGLAIAAGALVLPYAIYPNISLANYISILKLAPGHIFSLGTFLSNITRVAFFFLPIGLALACAWNEGAGVGRDFLRREGIYIFSILLALLLMSVPASMKGAGGHHLMPMVPLLACLGAALPPFRWDGSSRHRAAGIAVMVLGCSWLASCFTVEASQFYLVLTKAVTLDNQAERSEEDLKNITRDYPGYIILLGPGSDDSYPATYTRSQLVFEGMPIGVDPAALMDFQLSGHGDVDLVRLTDEIEKDWKKPALFLIPKGSKPFTMTNWVDSKTPLYPEIFRTEFAKMYARSGATEFFDIYTPVGANRGAK